MASFDIVSETDMQLVDNAINIARKELVNRFDFHGSKTTIELDKKEKTISIHTEDDMRMNSVIDIIRNRMIKQHIDPSCLDMGKDKDTEASGATLRKVIKIKQGIDRDAARDIVKDIKNTKLKVQPQIMDDKIRVTAKKIDDLQEVISLVRSKSYGLPLEFDNMK